MNKKPTYEQLLNYLILRKRFLDASFTLLFGEIEEFHKDGLIDETDVPLMKKGLVEADLNLAEKTGEELVALYDKLRDSDYKFAAIAREAVREYIVYRLGAGE